MTLLLDWYPPLLTNVNHALVQEDWCWGYRKYVQGNVAIESFERGSREVKRGLWTDPQPVPP